MRLAGFPPGRQQENDMAQQSKAARKTTSPRKTAGRKNSATIHTTRRRKAARAAKSTRWSARVTRTSDALTLEDKVFTRTPRQIAQSLKRSAERSRRRKASPYRSAMSMLTFYINRAGKNLSAARKRKLQAAKDELRELFGRA
jgi:hypothetical protein